MKKSRNENGGLDDAGRHDKNSRNFGKSDNGSSNKNCKLQVMFSNADVLTKDKMLELQIKVMEKVPDIIMIQEVKPKNSNRNLSPVEYQIDGYELLHVNIESDKGRGLCTFIKCGIEYV